MFASLNICVPIRSAWMSVSLPAIQQVISDVAAKTKALRDDVQRFGVERDEAAAKSLTAAVDQLGATLREEQVVQRREITEEIAAAVRSNFEALEAMIRGIKK